MSGVGFLVFLGCAVLSGLASAAWADRRDGPPRRAPGGAEAVRTRARFGGDGLSYPARPVRGDLWFPAGGDGGPPYFVGGARPPVALARGGRVLDAAPSGGAGGGLLRTDWTTVVHEVPDGSGTVRIDVPDGWARILVAELTAAPGAGQVGPEAFRVPWWRLIRVPGIAAAGLGLAAVLGVLGLHTFVLGEEVTAEVTGRHDGVCSVRWEDPWTGGTRTAGVDCYGGERAGDPLRIAARPWPLRGEAADMEDSPFMLTLGLTVTGAVGLAGTASASLGGAARLRRLRRHLRDGGSPEPSALRRAAAVVPWWSAAAGALGLAGAGLLVCAYGAGATVRATVTGTEEFVCHVAWTDPWDGTRRTAGVDCDDEAVEKGQSLEVSAAAWPLRGAAFDREATPWLLGGATAVCLGLAAAGVAGRALFGRGLTTRVRTRRRPAPASPGSVTPPGAPVSSAAPVSPERDPEAAASRPGEVPDPLDREHLTALARLLRSRLDTPARTPPREPDVRAVAWWRSPRLRGMVLTTGVPWFGLLVLVATAALSGWWWISAVRLWGAETATARATVEHRHEDAPLGPWLVPGDAEVAFRTADGRTVTTDVAHEGPGPREGDEVTVEYAVDSPSAARIAGDEGLGQGLVVSGTVAALVLTRGAWCAARATRRLRRLVRAARGSGARAADYLLLPDAGDPRTAPQLVFFEPGGGRRPFALLEADRGPRRAPTAARLPLEGAAELRWASDEPDTVVPWIGGRPLWPDSPLFDLSDPDEERDLREYVEEELTPPGVELPRGKETVR
ncbi:hypothetical protein [Streptomyces atacamensis]|uniref:hypothetical protein n=1 Tax=Streptomyces atacamensis TaxID=531966 RepID=UPI00399CFC48